MPVGKGSNGIVEAELATLAPDHRDKSQLTAMVDLMTRHLDRITYAVETLDERLQPVLRAETISAAIAGHMPEEGCSPLLEAITRRTAVLDYLAGRLESINRRLDV